VAIRFFVSILPFALALLLFQAKLVRVAWAEFKQTFYGLMSWNVIKREKVCTNRDLWISLV